MKKTSRYFLIGFGILVFFVFAPLLVLYVSGTRLNLSDRDTSSTGILDAKSSPSGSSVSLDSQDQGSTPAIVRFLNQDEYLLKISRSGYFDWSKRLPIESGKVTYAQVGVDAVQLIKQSEPVVIAPKGVSSFVLVGNDIWFANGNSIVKAPVNNPNNQTVIPLTFTPTSVTELRDKNHLFLGDNTILNIYDNTLIKLSGVPAKITLTPNNIVVAPNNIVLYSDGKNLNSFDPSTGKTVQVLANVTAFTMLNNTGYFVNGTSITTALWNGTEFTDFQNLINAPINSSNNSLFLTDNKELFCECNNQLFRIGQTLESVNNSVTSVKLDMNTNELTFITSSETWFYNFLSNTPQLLTRSTIQTNDFLIRSNIGYGFVANSSGLEVVEIDTRDKQNRYQILKDRPVYQLAMTSDEKTVLALQDGVLVSIQIRD